jgi:hypothetical protein
MLTIASSRPSVVAPSADKKWKAPAYGEEMGAFLDGTAWGENLR